LDLELALLDFCTGRQIFLRDHVHVIEESEQRRVETHMDDAAMGIVPSQITWMHQFGALQLVDTLLDLGIEQSVDIDVENECIRGRDVLLAVAARLLEGHTGAAMRDSPVTAGSGEFVIQVTSPLDSPE